MKSSSLLDSFGYALDGVMHVFRTQRHMRFHFFMVVLVLALAKVYRLDRTELLVLFFSICFVLITEMFNTAVEAVIDMVTQNYHPLAKRAKDVSAGAVLIASINAVVVGFLLFLDDARIRGVLARAYTGSPPSIVRAAVIEIAILLVLLVALRVLGHNRPGRRVPVSTHTAIGFSLATMAIALASQEIALVVFLMLLAVLIAHSRLQHGWQNFRAVFNGALLGTCLPVMLLKLLP